MADLTEEEYDALDEKWTKTTPKAGPNGAGFFARRKAEMSDQSVRSITVDSFTADYLLTKAIAVHKTPAEIIAIWFKKKSLQHNIEPSGENANAKVPVTKK